ncbi:fibronectin type III domain-containing protein [Allomuricauda sp. XS_ASV26]|uniref:fibronectin type III domain-containing protein n=1 Tax=Allomuricauda sp. XS_ASV26 TaxID=3241292 RepID=UPI003510E1FD
MSNKQFTIIKRKNYQSLVNVILNIEKNLTWPQTYQSLFNKLFIVYCLLYTVLATAQIYPVQVTPQIIPPYSFQLSDYTTTTQEKLFVNLLLTDAQESGRQVRLKLYVEGPGINFQSTDFVSGTIPIILNGGINNRLTNLDLQAYFNYNNLVGISQQQYGQQLPEGQYRFCFEVYDQFSGQRISNRSCANIYLLLNDPPLLNVPFRGDLVTAQKPQNIIFNWTPRHINAGAVQYEFTLKELWDTGMDPQAAFLASPPLYQTTTYATTLHYGPAQMPLLEGKTYGWQVRAFVSDGFTETSLFRNNGMSEIYHFTYRADCPPPRFVLSEAENSQTVKINWQMEQHLRYRVQYRKKGYGEDDWFGLWSQANEATIRNLESGTTYEFRVGGECTPNGGLAYSAIHEFTTPTEDEMAYYNCGIPPDVEISNQDPLLSLGVNEVFMAGDFPVTVVEVQRGNGLFSGKGFITVPYFGDTKITVGFTNIIVNTDYQLIDGLVQTEYDPSWSNIGDVDAFVEDIGELFNAINELLSNYTGTEEEVSLLQELNQKQDDHISELLSSPHITIETKNELVANQEVYKTISNDLIAESTSEDGYDTGNGMADQVIQKNNKLQTSIEKAEDEIFLGEAQRILNDPENSVAFWETIEKLEEIYDFLKQCNSEDWESYQDKGIVPYCLWRDAEVANENLYSGSDIPYLSGLVDGVYMEVDGVLKLPQLLKDLGSGIHQLIYSFTVAYIECNPMAVKVNRERLNKLLETVEVPDERKGLLDWMKEELDKFTVDDEERQEQLQQYLDKCKGFDDTRQAVEDFFEFITDWKEIKNLSDQVSEKLWETLEVYSYYSFVNEERYERAVLDVQLLSVATGIGAVTKIKKVKDILIGLRNFTKAQWDDLGRRLGKNGNLLDEALIVQLRASGVKFTEADLIWIFKNNKDKIIFLEKGNTSSGFEHILRHKQEFIDAGISETNISDFILQALKKNKIVGYQGSGNGRPIYELIYQGNKQRIAITTGSNGYVVGANMKSATK